MRARTVESQKTRRRLDALEKAANQFMEDYSDEEMSRDPKRKERGAGSGSMGIRSARSTRRWSGSSHFKCWLTVRSKAFPEIGEANSWRSSA